MKHVVAGASGQAVPSVATITAYLPLTPLESST
jgi:hypothetical protein